MDAIKAGSGDKFLVAASDLRIAAPNSEFEMQFGDGSAAFLVGNRDLLATINEHYSVSSEFIDTWRRDKDRWINK